MHITYSHFVYISMFWCTASHLWSYPGLQSACLLLVKSRLFRLRFPIGRSWRNVAGPFLSEVNNRDNNSSYWGEQHVLSPKTNRKVPPGVFLTLCQNFAYFWIFLSLYSAPVFVIRINSKSQNTLQNTFYYLANFKRILNINHRCQSQYFVLWRISIPTLCNRPNISPQSKRILGDVWMVVRVSQT